MRSILITLCVLPVLLLVLASAATASKQNPTVDLLLSFQKASGPIHSWSAALTREFLTQAGFSADASAKLLDGGIDGSTLMSMHDDDAKGLGLDLASVIKLRAVNGALCVPFRL